MIEGNLTFGNAPTDNISFAADIDSNFIPDDNATFNLGSQTQQWNKLFITDIQANALAVTSSVLTIDSSGNVSSSISISPIWFTCYTWLLTVGGSTSIRWKYNNWWNIRCNWCN